MFGVLRPGSPQRERERVQIPISPTASPLPPRSLAPMPPSEFGNREELMAGCKAWAGDQGYAVVIARSRLNRLWIKCDRGGKYENRRQITDDQRKRKRGDSRLLGCPFKMLAHCNKNGTWRVETDVAEHNHGPSNDVVSHPTLRRMTEEQTQRLNDMVDEGRSPAETLEELRTLWPDIKVLTRDVYNARQKYKSYKAEVEAAASLLEQQSYEDPNGVFPGPSPNGRWAWVPDGEEVTNKKAAKKKKKRTAPTMPSTLDPQLQTDASHTSHSGISAAGQQLLDGFTELNQAPHLRNAQSQFGGYESAPSNMQRHAPIDGVGDTSGLYQNAEDHSGGFAAYSNHQINHQTNTSPSRLRSQRQAAPTAPMSTALSTSDIASLGAVSGGQKVPSGQVLMSRIERMEKEQRDQKQMLAQILGAVQGMHGSPG